MRRLALLTLLLAAVGALWWSQHSASRQAEGIAGFLSQHAIPGAVMAVRIPGRQTTVEVFGTAASPQATPFGAHTRLPIASISKPLTATAIRALVAQDRIEFDDRIFDLLPELRPQDKPGFDAITVRHLLSHVPGFSQREGDPMFADGQLAGCAAAISRSLAAPLEAPPGQRMQHSNAGYCLLGLLIERATSMTYDEAVRKLLADAGATGTQHLTLGPPTGDVPHEGQALPAELWRAAGAAGGWFCDATTLVDILSMDARSPEIAVSGATSPAEYYYGLGWRVWPLDDGYRLTHFGSLADAFSVVVAYPDGRAAVILLNGRPSMDERSFRWLASQLDRKLTTTR